MQIIVDIPDELIVDAISEIALKHRMIESGMDTATARDNVTILILRAAQKNTQWDKLIKSMQSKKKAKR